MGLCSTSSTELVNVEKYKTKLFYLCPFFRQKGSGQLELESDIGNGNILILIEQ